MASTPFSRVRTTTIEISRSKIGPFWFQRKDRWQGSQKPGFHEYDFPRRSRAIAKLPHGWENLRGHLFHHVAGRSSLGNEVEGDVMDAGFTHCRQRVDQPSPARSAATIDLLVGGLRVLEQFQHHGLAEATKLRGYLALGIMPKCQPVFLDGQWPVIGHPGCRVAGDPFQGLRR